MQLRRAPGLWQRFYGVGTMVGAGIYSVIGAAAGEAGPALWLSFIGAGLAAALSYAELASMCTVAGAESQYLRAAFPRWRLPAFLAGLMIMLNAATAASSARESCNALTRARRRPPSALSANRAVPPRDDR